MDKRRSDGGVRGQFRGTGLYWNLILALVVVVAVIIGIIQNSQGIRLKYLAWTVSMPLGVALLVTIVLTVALASLVGMMWRRRRRHQLTDSVELRKLRGQTQEQATAARGADASAAGRSSGASA